VPLQRAVEIVEHDAWFDDAAAIGGVDLDDPVQPARRVENQRIVDRLTALRGSAAACGDLDAFLARNGERRGKVLGVCRRCHADRENLIERGIRRVSPAGERIEKDFPPQRPAKFSGQHWFMDRDSHCAFRIAIGLLPE
jgi:hypothetical protein